MANVITVIVLIIVLGSAVGYIIKSKKKGAKCIGCPCAGECHSKNSGKSCGSGNNN